VKRVRFHPEARIEAQAAATWYRKHSREAARGFTRAMAEGIQSVRERPEAWAPWRRVDVRRCLLRRFPYSIFFVLESDVIVIVAIAHHRRRPGYWIPRLGR
jgi:plasmid stabilization system protein ParE